MVTCEGKVCQGPKDPNLYACRHIWREDQEKGCSDNQTYIYCENCGLICSIPKGEAYPPECIIHRMKQSKQLNPSLQKSQDEQKKLVNAKDFQNPRESKCGECEE